MRTVDLLDAIKRRHNIPSDYALAPVLSVSRQTISKLRNRHDILSPQLATQAAILLDLPLAYVLACIEEERAERAHQPAVRKAWHDAARRLAPALAAMAIFSAASAPESRAAARTSVQAGESVYYVNRRRQKDGASIGALSA